MSSLLTQIHSGDEQVIAEFYHDYSPKILRYLQKRLPHEEAREILNDVFLEAIDSLPTLNKHQNLQSWLFTIAHHNSVDFYRKKRIKSLLFSQLPFLEIIASEMSQPEFQMEKDKIRDKIESSLTALSNKYEHILRLHYEEDKPIKEIALMYNLSPKATESLLYRARKHFMKSYERT